ncbi:SpaA isopeptide-forming pilin-related protein [Sediminibacillus halophilus]|uniref:LPXTG-motif cell wall anchor domain-containing protein/conserved repeat domain-containing protein n=1 Tax=Sediminibacillus halophilus TaxID=482461 RepID=A0A1G9TAB0_9BACI|nr:SpaA isopeptide-forming pilin-related protein [Sediminibacillus halophilus]SDM44591.1 LPXTG-motif cell wall anchor domain-containing protein/conserved repeat domain-containing protein [Sediminibacillus halophilus]
MKRAFSTILIVIVMFSSYGSTALAAIQQSSQDPFQMEVVGKSSHDKTVVRFASKDKNTHRAEVKLPTKAKLNIQKSKEFTNEDIRLSYDKTSHKVTFEQKEEATLINSKIVLTNLKEGDNTILAQGYSNGEKLSSQKLTFSVAPPSSTPNNNIESESPNTELSDENQVNPSQDKPAQESNDAEGGITNKEGSEQSNEQKKEKQNSHDSSKEEQANTDTEEENNNNKQPREKEEASEQGGNKLGKSQSKEPTEETGLEGESKKEQTNKREINEEKETVKVSSLNNIGILSGNLNVDIDISPQYESVLAGKAAAYKLVFKTTGSLTQYTDAEVSIDLPITNFTSFTQDLEELKINGVTPTYDASSQRLNYNLGNIASGRTYETVLKINTENGVSPDGYGLDATATFMANEQMPVSDDATVDIEASKSASVSKQFLEVQDNDRNLVSPGAKTLWEIELNIPKKESGEMYLKEDSQIVMTDILPEGLSYDSMKSGPEPSQNGNQLSWTFETPTIEEQSNADKQIYSQKVQVWLTANQGTAGTTQTNQVETETTYIDDSTKRTVGEDSVTVVDSDQANGEFEGNYLAPVHLGPVDGVGNAASFDNKNPNPVVYDDALLGFEHGIAPLPESEAGDFEQYVTVYDIDRDLVFEKLDTPGGFRYKPTRDSPNGVPLNEDPRFNIVASVNGEEQTLVENAETDRTYTRGDFGLTETDEVDYIKYDFTYAPSGMLNIGRAKYYFSVKEGTTGEVVNTFNVYGIDGDGNAFNKHYDEDSRDSVAGPRSATIATKPEGQPPIATVGVKLLEQNNGEVTSGDNRMQVDLNNTNNSPLAMNEKLETVVLLPPGVTIKDQPNADYIDKDGKSSQATTSAAGGSYEVLSNNFNDSGRQLVRISWNDSILRPGSSLSAQLDINIPEDTPNNLIMDVYGFSGDEQLDVPDNDGDTTDTILETDAGDLNEDDVTDEPRLKSGNTYFMRGEYQIETEKLVKGELDEEFSSFGKTTPGGTIDYQLKLTNSSGKNISNLTLIDVLPSVDDLGITDNVERGSQFTPTFNGAIQLPDSWTDRVEVFYSTVENPKRDDLTRYTDYPETTEPLNNPLGAQEPNWMTASEVNDWSNIHSFKIQSKEDTKWLVGEDITIGFSMQAPDASDVPKSILDGSVDPTSRAAWNSFAVATDKGQPVEPFRVGAYMNYDNMVELTKNGENGKVLSGAIFDLQDSEGNVIQSGLTTGGDGKIVVESLFTGDYQFVETKAPKGYKLDETPIPFTIEVGQSEAVTVTAENELIPGSVELTKVGEEGETLEGAEFKLLNENGEEIQSELTTDEEGKLVVENLKPGNYQFVEVKAPFGHELDETPLPFEIAFNQQEPVQVEKENERQTSAVELTKQGEGGAPLEGVTFELQDQEGTTLQGGLTTDENGKLMVQGLKPGSYQFVETESIAGYELNAAPITFEIELGQKEKTTVEAINKLTPGSVELTKVGEEGETLEGAEFKLLNEDGEEIQSGLTTNEEGKLVVENLKPGNYQFIETKAPSGYQLDSSAVPFEVMKNQKEIATVTVKNEKIMGSLQIIKVDDQTDKTLQGAVFEVRDSDNKVLSTLKTNNMGMARLNFLVPGQYTLVETKAPEGYERLKEPITFTIDKEKLSAKLVIENVAIPETPKTHDESPKTPDTPEKEPKTLPQTGEEWLRTLFLLGLVLVGVGGVLLIGSRYERVEE